MSGKAKQNLSSNSDPIQALMPKAGGTEEVTTGNRSSAVTSNVIRILGTSGTPRIRFGDITVVADSTDPLLIVDVPEYFSIGVGQYVAVVDGTIEVSNMESN